MVPSGCWDSEGCFPAAATSQRVSGDQELPKANSHAGEGRVQCDTYPPVLCDVTQSWVLMWIFLLQSSLRISPPLPFLPLSGVSRDPLKMGVGSQLDQDQAALAAVTPSPASASKRWPGASAWPSWDLLDSPEDPFSIEREARLHRQAAGKADGGSQQASVAATSCCCSSAEPMAVEHGELLGDLWESKVNGPVLSVVGACPSCE